MFGIRFGDFRLVSFRVTEVFTTDVSVFLRSKKMFGQLFSTTDDRGVWQKPRSNAPAQARLRCSYLRDPRSLTYTVLILSL